MAGSACAENDFLVVTGSSFRLCRDPYEPLVSELELTMGMRLSLAEKPGTVKSVRGRISYDNYIVNVPSRAADGSLKFIEALVPISRDVHIGYMPFTYSNVIRLADKTRGEIYGWGRHARRTGLFRACYGNLPLFRHNAAAQHIRPCQASRKIRSGCFFPFGGSEAWDNPESACGCHSFLSRARYDLLRLRRQWPALPERGGQIRPVQSSATQNVYTVEVCSLDVRLSNGKTWLEAVEKIIRIGWGFRGHRY